MSTAAASTIVPDRRRIAVRLLFGAAALGLLAVAVTSLPGLGEVRRRLADAGPGWLVAALALELGSCLAFVVAYRGVLYDRLPWRASYEIGMAVQGTNVLVPAGGASGLAVGAWALRRAGVPGERLALAHGRVLPGDQLGELRPAGRGRRGARLGLLPGDAPLALTAGPAALAGAAIVAVLALPRVLARTARARRPGARRRACSRPARWSAPGASLVIGGAVGYMALDMAALAAAFAAVGTMPSLGVFMLAYVLGQLGGLIPLPGGVGGADSGVIGALVLYGTALPDAAAAVLAYRAFQLGLPALLGACRSCTCPRSSGAPARAGGSCRSRRRLRTARRPARPGSPPSAGARRRCDPRRA